MDDQELKELLSQIGPHGRDVLRRLMRAEQFERDEFSEALKGYPSSSAPDLINLIDLASLNPDVRRRLARVLGEIEANPSS